MKTVSIAKDRSTHYLADKGDTTYVLEKGVTIDTQEMAGLIAATSVARRDIVVKGTISVATGFGIHVGAEDYSGAGNLLIAKSGQVSGKIAVHLAADGQVLTNAGTILGATGIESNGDHSRIVNTGDINTSGSGIDVSFSSARIVNDGFIHSAKATIYSLVGSEDTVKIVNNGTLSSDYDAVQLSNLSGARTVLVNHGDITATYKAISGSFNAATDVVRNRGEIIGSIWLGNGNDVFDGRGGQAGWVDGGKDNDRYIIDDPLAKLSEQTASGTDTVRSSVTWTMGNSFENLVLTGSDSISGKGNGEANRITGNAGENTLFGYAGTDILHGAAGDDVLYGGTEADTFLFATGGRHDTIADFQDGIDLIDITGVKGIKTFDQIAEAMTQVGADVVIALGGKDVIEIDNTTIAKLTMVDFAY